MYAIIGKLARCSTSYLTRIARASESNDNGTIVGVSDASYRPRRYECPTRSRYSDMPMPMMPSTIDTIMPSENID